MTAPIIQIPTLVLPRTYRFTTEVETINDLVIHPSFTINPIKHLHEKMVHVIATEVVAAGMPGNLLCWIELSTTGVAGTWGAIGGGGGGVLPPVAPIIEVATGVGATVHNIFLPWNIFEFHCRLVVQMPVAATPLTDHWTLQGWFMGQG